MNKLITVRFLFLLLICGVAQAQNNKQPLAVSPPMGWNSYNCFGATVRENEVKANADVMAKKLHQFGWEYIVIDYCWFYPHPPMSLQDNPPQFRLPKDGSYVPWLAMDDFGRLLPDQGKFPSCPTSLGFKPIADYVHGLGLKFGIHLMRGIPRQAVWAKTPVKGAMGIDASMIADTTSTCGWLNSMYGINMDKDGAQEYLNSLFELYAQWGVDFVKIDDLSNPYSTKEIEGYHKAIDVCGREMVFSTSPGATPLNEGSHVEKQANMWRVSGDFWDNWEQLFNMFELANQWTPYRTTGHWPDLDMLQLGRLSRRGPVGNERETRFTKDEQFTHLTLWCIAKSPLMMGGDLTVADSFTVSLLSNEEVLAVNQNSINNRQVKKENGIVIWMADIPNSNDKYVAFFNTSDHKAKFSIELKELGLKGKLEFRDLWEKKDLGKFNRVFTTELNGHACSIYKINSFKNK